MYLHISVQITTKKVKNENKIRADNMQNVLSIIYLIDLLFNLILVYPG